MKKVKLNLEDAFSLLALLLIRGKNKEAEVIARKIEEAELKARLKEIEEKKKELKRLEEEERKVYLGSLPSAVLFFPAGAGEVVEFLSVGILEEVGGRPKGPEGQSLGGI